MRRRVAPAAGSSVTPAPTVTWPAADVDRHRAGRAAAGPPRPSPSAGRRRRRGRCCRPAAPARGRARAPARTTTAHLPRCSLGRTTTLAPPAPATRPVHRVRRDHVGVGHHVRRPPPRPSQARRGQREEPAPSPFYPARMVALPDTAREVLEGPHLAHVVTMNPDGSPQVSCVWVGLDGDEVVFASLGPVAEAAQPRARPARRAVGGGSRHQRDRDAGVPRAPGHRHRAAWAGHPSSCRSWPTCTSGPDVKFPPMDDPPPGSVVRITVDKLTGVGPWHD